MSDKKPKEYEVFFALIGAVGTDLSLIQTSLEKSLKLVDYKTYSIRLSEMIRTTINYPDIYSGEYEYDRINSLMDAGNQVRKTAKSADAVALLGVANIVNFRTNKLNDNTSTRQAYIVNSLKNPKEVESLRNIYGDSLFIISVFSSADSRRSKLAKMINNHPNVSKTTKSAEELADELIKKDETQGFSFGQNTRETFHTADFFINSEDISSVEKQVTRIIELIFSNPFYSPSVEEYCMFHAYTSSLRSLDLSRQVGAVIAKNDGTILSTGCNEVPIKGGGSFWTNYHDNIDDNRDFVLGYDSNTTIRNRSISEFIRALVKNEAISLKNISEEDLVNILDHYPDLKNTRIANITEFGRPVHAEMNALIDAARKGISIQDANLYCTTFPCHNCTKHIISAGINRVYYIEPYPKSLAKELYPKSIDFKDRSSEHSSIDRVQFIPFSGISPRRYIDLFSYTKRKKRDGNKINWNPSTSKPISCNNFRDYSKLEDHYIEQTDDLLNHDIQENNHDKRRTENNNPEF